MTLDTEDRSRLASIDSEQDRREGGGASRGPGARKLCYCGVGVSKREVSLKPNHAHKVSRDNNCTLTGGSSCASPGKHAPANSA